MPTYLVKHWLLNAGYSRLPSLMTVSGKDLRFKAFTSGFLYHRDTHFEFNEELLASLMFRCWCSVVVFYFLERSMTNDKHVDREIMFQCKHTCFCSEVVYGSISELERSHQNIPGVAEINAARAWWWMWRDIGLRWNHVPSLSGKNRRVIGSLWTHNN